MSGKKTKAARKAKKEAEQAPLAFQVACTREGIVHIILSRPVAGWGMRPHEAEELAEGLKEAAKAGRAAAVVG
jgi:hypothetical protein